MSAHRVSIFCMMLALVMTEPSVRPEASPNLVMAQIAQSTTSLVIPIWRPVTYNSMLTNISNVSVPPYLLLQIQCQVPCLSGISSRGVTSAAATAAGCCCRCCSISSTAAPQLLRLKFQPSSQPRLPAQATVAQHNQLRGRVDLF